MPIIVIAITVVTLVLTLLYLKSTRAERKRLDVLREAQKNQSLKQETSLDSTEKTVFSEVESIKEVPVEPVVPPVESQLADDTVDVNDEETSILDRHYLSHIRMMLAHTSHPCPTDSALSRHYDEMIDNEAKKYLADEALMTQLVEAYEKIVDTQEILDDNEEEADESGDDSILKRHQLSNIRMMLAHTSHPRPTDSALARHYDAMIDDEAEKYLDEAQMEKLFQAYQNATDKLV